MAPPWPLHSFSPIPLTLILLLLLLTTCVWTAQPVHSNSSPTSNHAFLASLRADTRHLFWHGYDNYIAHAFPDDELAPLSCRPKTRNRANPADIGINDGLGNYSLTLVDSLSTLAILASDCDEDEGAKALQEFQWGVEALVGLYGDGREGVCGSRACGFDLDSKVQVFETNIRGVGGLLSAHLFAVAELPIIGYYPKWTAGNDNTSNSILWPTGFVYDGQLLRLAHDLASRLLPAFATSTGLPYPRVNLRTGIPFYHHSTEGFCRLDGSSSEPRDVTETCAAGAGSLVLEFATLSRLTGDPRFEFLAKRAFWAVWDRRSNINLLGAGLDAENGQWIIPALAGIGAGSDSFYEYALKSSILLSGLPGEDEVTARFLAAWQIAHAAVKRHLHRDPSSSTSSSGLGADLHPYYAQADLHTGAPRYSWIDNLSAYYPGLLALAGELPEAQRAHLLHTALWTRYGALPERWHAPSGSIDPNFRHWAGRPEFVESTFYLHQATKDPWYLHVGEMVLRDVRRRCWTACGWAVLTDVSTGEQGDRMESFFLGETAKYLFLLFSEDHPLNRGDAAVVFSTEGHPLTIPRPKVEGAKSAATKPGQSSKPRPAAAVAASRPAAAVAVPALTCSTPPALLPLTLSPVAARGDLFHAAALAGLHLVSTHQSHAAEEAGGGGSALYPQDPLTGRPGVTYSDLRSPSNYSFYPWTLPRDLIPPKGMSGRIKGSVVSTLTFPHSLVGNEGAGQRRERGRRDRGSETGGTIGDLNLNLNLPPPFGALQKVIDGVLVSSLSGVRLSMVLQQREDKGPIMPVVGSVHSQDPEALYEGELGEYRVQGIANWALGRDEKVWIAGVRALEGVSPADPHFTRVRDEEMVDLVVDVPTEVDQVVFHEEEGGGGDGSSFDDGEIFNATMDAGLLWQHLDALVQSGLISGVDFDLDSTSNDNDKAARPAPAAASKNPPLSTSNAAAPPPPSPNLPQPQIIRHLLPAILPTGPGAASDLPRQYPLSSSSSSSTSFEDESATLHPLGQLPYHRILFLDSTLCPPHALPTHLAAEYEVLVVRRGGCSFVEKLESIPAVPNGSSGSKGLQLVIVLSSPSSSSSPSAQEDATRGGAGAGGGGEEATGPKLIRPLLERTQRLSGVREGRERRPPLAMVMVDAGGGREEVLKLVAGKVGRYDEDGRLVFFPEKRNTAGSGQKVVARPGLGFKRRYWFESMGVPIANLIVL